MFTVLPRHLLSTVFGAIFRSQSVSIFESEGWGRGKLLSVKALLTLFIQLHFVKDGIDICTVEDQSSYLSPSVFRVTFLFWDVDYLNQIAGKRRTHVTCKCNVCFK